MSYRLIRPLLFALPPETAHRLTLNGLAAAHRMGMAKSRVSSPARVMGLAFPNRVGLAAGLDKNGDYAAPLASLGFGFVEVGTVTPRAQPGNPAPRLFRLKRDEALINRMGFNNEGAAHLSVAVPRERDFILGINIGKNKDTPADRAVDDYTRSLELVYGRADYVSVNVSSPNTEGLRNLQGADPLRRLLAGLAETREALAGKHGRRVPLAVKVAPELEAGQIDQIAAAVVEHGFDGVIATNTTTARGGVTDKRRAVEAGGLSGRPLLREATRALGHFHRALDGRAALIASGGVMSPNAARVKQRAGADLVQLYTGLIYRGPRLVRECARALDND